MAEELLEGKPRKLTPEEIELASFKERRRLDNVKKELGKFRRKDSIFNTPPQMDIFREGSTILPQSKKKKQKGQRSKNILSVKGGLF